MITQDQAKALHDTLKSLLAAGSSPMPESAMNAAAQLVAEVDLHRGSEKQEALLVMSDRLKEIASSLTGDDDRDEPTIQMLRDLFSKVLNRLLGVKTDQAETVN